jgi:glucosylceramidase
MKTSSFLSLMLLIAGSGQRPASNERQNGSAASYDVAGKRAVVYTTADSTPLRLVPTDTLVFTPSEPTSEQQVYVFVDPRKTFQAFLGIGGALTDASAETFAKLPASRQEELLHAYYDTTRGIGYTIARTNSTAATSRARAIPMLMRAMAS